MLESYLIFSRIVENPEYCVTNSKSFFRDVLGPQSSSGEHRKGPCCSCHIRWHLNASRLSKGWKLRVVAFRSVDQHVWY